jgi:hypothetical protein
MFPRLLSRCNFENNGWKRKENRKADAIENLKGNTNLINEFKKKMNVLETKSRETDELDFATIQNFNPKDVLNDMVEHKIW